MNAFCGCESRGRAAGRPQRIGDYAFGGCALEEIRIPDSRANRLRRVPVQQPDLREHPGNLRVLETAVFEWNGSPASSFRRPFAGSRVAVDPECVLTASRLQADSSRCAGTVRSYSNPFRNSPRKPPPAGADGSPFPSNDRRAGIARRRWRSRRLVVHEQRDVRLVDVRGGTTRAGIDVGDFLALRGLTASSTADSRSCTVLRDGPTNQPWRTALLPGAASKPATIGSPKEPRQPGPLGGRGGQGRSRRLRSSRTRRRGCPGSGSLAAFVIGDLRGRGDLGVDDDARPPPAPGVMPRRRRCCAASDLAHLVDEAGRAAGDGFGGRVLREDRDHDGLLRRAGLQSVPKPSSLRALGGQRRGVLVVRGGGRVDRARRGVRHARVEADDRCPSPCTPRAAP